MLSHPGFCPGFCCDSVFSYRFFRSRWWRNAIRTQAANEDGARRCFLVGIAGRGRPQGQHLHISLGCICMYPALLNRQVSDSLRDTKQEQQDEDQVQLAAAVKKLEEV